MVLSSERSFVALVRSVVAEVGIDVCASKLWEAVDEGGLDPCPALLVVDLSVDHRDRAWATLDRLASNPQLRTIPIVVCPAASWLLDGRADALARSGVQVWREPYDPGQLIAAAQTALEPITEGCR